MVFGLTPTLGFAVKLGLQGYILCGVDFNKDEL